MIVPATKEHFKTMYGNEPRFTMRAFSIVDKDNVIAIGGIYKSNTSWIAFVNLSERAKQKKKYIIELKKNVIPLFKGKKIYALRDEKVDTSEGVLKHFGFNRLEGEIWQLQSHI